MSKLVAEIIVETMREAGVQRCYGIAGDTLNRIAEEIDHQDRRLRQQQARLRRDRAARRGHAEPLHRRGSRNPARPCAAKAVLAGRGGDVLEMIKENFI